MKKIIAITLFLLASFAVIFSIISCGYDAGSLHLARGDYTGAYLARAYYKEYITGIVILSIIFAVIGGITARKKNRSFIGWFLLCGFFWVIPLIVIAALKSNDDYLRYKFSNTNYNNIKLNLKKCPFCAEEIKKDAIYCRFCRKEISAYEKEIQNEKNNEFKNSIERKISELKLLFDQSIDKNEKSKIAKKLYDLGQTEYWENI